MLFFIIMAQNTSNIPNQIVFFYKKDVTLESQKMLS